MASLTITEQMQITLSLIECSGKKGFYISVRNILEKLINTRKELLNRLDNVWAINLFRRSKIYSRLKEVDRSITEWFKSVLKYSPSFTGDTIFE